MTNPVGTFRWFHEVAGRRPKLVSFIGLGLIAEAARVWIGLDAGEPVTLLGRGGFEVHDPYEDGGALAAYAFWVGFCGVLLLVLTRFARRSVGRATAPVGRATAPAARATTVAASGVGGRLGSSPPVVQRMRRFPETRRRGTLNR